MSPTSSLRLVVDADPADETPSPAPAETPGLFVRQLVAPPGAPWDQARAADLDARLGAPLPLDELNYRLRRLEPWRPGAAGRYAALYVRAREVAPHLTVNTRVAGRLIRVRFVAPEERARRLRLGLIAAVAAVVGFGAAAGGVTTALASRTESEARLAALEQGAAANARRAEAVARRKVEARALDAAGARGRRLADVVDDLAWAAQAKAPDARIRAVHWDHGYLAVEVEGDAAPFARTDRAVERAAKALRPGVWLWGVAPPGEKARR